MKLFEAHPSLAEAYKTGKSSCSSKKGTKLMLIQNIHYNWPKTAEKFKTKGGESD